MIFLRIISGKYKGKVLKGYNIEGTRPTMDRVKESIYGIIQGYVKDSTVLDLFAGSASLGLEAISNGAKKLVLIDNNKKVTDIIKSNIKSFDDDLDPPYRAGLMNKALRIIEERNIINKNGIIICEFENIKIKTSLELIREKRYGSKMVCIYKKN